MEPLHLHFLALSAPEEKVIYDLVNLPPAFKFSLLNNKLFHSKYAINSS